MQALAALLGLSLPVALAAGVLGLVRADAVSAVGLLAAAATANAAWPIGGGMAVEGAYRTRLFGWEWTFDARRSRREQFLGPFTLAAVTLGGFVAALPVLAVAWRAWGLSGLGRELSALGALFAVVIVGLARHRPELPYASWRAEAEAAPKLDPEPWTARVVELSRRVTRDGAIGSVGGIGAATVGLHEHLDALAVLRVAARDEIPGAAALLAGGLACLRQRREAGGFPVYPGALANEGCTRRAEETLRGDG